MLCCPRKRFKNQFNSGYEHWLQGDDFPFVFYCIEYTLPQWSLPDADDADDSLTGLTQHGIIVYGEDVDKSIQRLMLIEINGKTSIYSARALN